VTSNDQSEKTELRRLLTGTRLPNNHHHVQHALDFPDVTYKFMPNSRRVFVYDNRAIYHGQMPLGRVINGELFVKGKPVFKGTMKQILSYCCDHLLEKKR